MRKKLFFLFITYFINWGTSFSQNQIKTLGKNGAWCWFSEPRAIIVDSTLITGWVSSNGSIIAARLNINNGLIEKDELYRKLEKDDHNNPSFEINEDGKVIALYLSLIHI